LGCPIGLDSVQKVFNFQENLHGGKWLVKDIDDETDRTSTVKRNLIIPLPKYRADPQRDGHALFPREAIVLALYPQTTCFYKGVVDVVPATATDDYMIMFEDPAYASGFSPSMPAPQGFVINYKEIQAGKNGRRKKKADD
jgi:SAGA-associated factor 29